MKRTRVKPLGFFNSINDELRMIIPFLKSMIIRETEKQNVKTWDCTKRKWIRHSFNLVECREVNIDQKFGTLHVQRTTGDRDAFVIESDKIRYQIAPNMLGIVLKDLEKAIK